MKQINTALFCIKTMREQEGESESETAGCDRANIHPQREVITLSAPYEWQLCKYELEWDQDNQAQWVSVHTLQMKGHSERAREEALYNVWAVAEDEGGGKTV